MSPLALAVAAAGFLTCALSGVVGLGGGTVLLGMLYTLGLQPAEALPLFAMVQLASNATRTVTYARDVEWQAAGWFLLAAAPAPFLVAPLVAGVNTDVASLMLAGLILASLVPLGNGTALGQRPAFLLAGLANGSVGMFVGATGLFSGRLFLRPEWSKEAVIGTFAMTQALGHLMRLLGYVSAGFWLAECSALLLPLTAAVVAGTFVGKALNSKLDEARFRHWFKAILLVLSLNLIRDGAAGLWFGIGNSLQPFSATVLPTGAHIP